jgi:hypothetical protein
MPVDLTDYAFFLMQIGLWRGTGAAGLNNLVPDGLPLARVDPTTYGGF